MINRVVCVCEGVDISIFNLGPSHILDHLNVSRVFLVSITLFNKHFSYHILNVSVYMCVCCWWRLRGETLNVHICDVETGTA